MSLEFADAPAVVFRGSKARCREYSLVLEARGIDHHVDAAGDLWSIRVAAATAGRAYDELSHYADETSAPRTVRSRIVPFAGAAAASLGYVIALTVVASFAARSLFGADWLVAGALDAGAPHQWWRAITALTLHVEPEHLLGNLLFGAIAGTAAGRLLGPGLAWGSIIGAGTLANLLEMAMAPPDHRAIGASTAVFAALGLLTGLAWRQQLSSRERRWYRWAPLIAGTCLLTLLGAGTEHVDVLGHGLGFLAGLALGWMYARFGIPRRRSAGPQIAAGVGVAAALIAAWVWALAR